MMAGIRGKDTKPELQIRKRLHAEGFRYRLHTTDVPGKPDIVLRSYRAAIFIHGCFWHGHDCPLFKLPDTRQDFWREKFRRNRIRDAAVQEQLAEAGWRQMTIWECAIRGRGKLGLEETVTRTSKWIRSPCQVGELRSQVIGIVP